MPRTRSLAWSELKVGLLTLGALVTAAVVIFLLSGEGGFFWQRYPLKATFAEVGGLKTGAPVRLAGVEVGAVTDVRFKGAEVEVTFEISREMQTRVTTKSVAVVGSVSLLGEAALDLTASTEGTPVAPGGQVVSKQSGGALADVAAGATASLEQATLLLQEIRAGRGTVGKLFTDEQLYRDVQGFVDAAEAVAQNLKQGRGTIGKLAMTDGVYKSLEASLANLQALTDRLNRGEGSLGQLLKDDRFARAATATTENLEALTGRLNRGEGTAGKLLTDDALYTRLDTVAGRVDELVKRLNEGQGTAGRLLQDQKLYDSLNQAAHELSGLLGDIRKDPQKYLRVKVSLF